MKNIEIQVRQLLRIAVEDCYLLYWVQKKKFTFLLTSIVVFPFAFPSSKK